MSGRTVAMERRTSAGASLTELLVLVTQVRPSVERLAQRLAEPAGLTFSGWQVSSALGDGEATVPVLAKRLGRTRQSVQVAVDELVESGHAAKVGNPSHRRSPLVTLTPRGRTAFWDAVTAHVQWVNQAATDLNPGDLEAAVRIMSSLAAQLCDSA
jgi:DNA-binding MarR family transcriptional regulator